MADTDDTKTPEATPVDSQETTPAPVPDQDNQEADNPDASKKAGEAQGPKTDEQKAAEKPLKTAKKTNPVGEATQKESKDPYAEGKHIANPEPNNGRGDDSSDEL